MTVFTLRRAAVLLVVGTASGCVPPPSGYAAPYQQPYPPYQTAQNGYPPPANYPPPVYSPNYPPPAAYPPAGAPVYPDDQYTYIDGLPYAVYGGQQEVVVFDPGLGWGFYDPYHHWHRAPERWRGEFEHRFPGGRGYSPSPPRDFGARPGYPPPGRPPEAVHPGAFQAIPGRAPGLERAPEPRVEERRAPEPRVEERRAPERPAEPRGAEQRVNAPRPEAPPPRPEAAPRPQAPAPPPQQRPAPRGTPACGEPGAPRC